MDAVQIGRHRERPEKMKIVPVSEIPRDISHPPLEDLMALYRTCDQMAALCDEKNGIGLAAPQVGIPQNLFIIKDGEKYRFFINCKYMPVGISQHHSLENVCRCQ